MKYWYFFVLLTLVVSQSFADDWKTKVSPNGLRSVYVSAPGTSPEGPIETMLTLECHPDKDGAISLMYTVQSSDKIKSFDFNEFEGPDAPAAEKKFLHIELNSIAEPITVDTEVGGWYIENLAFVFGFSSPNRKDSDLAKISRKMFTPQESILVRVQDSKKPDVFLTTKFPLQNASTLIQETMQPCFQQ